VDEGDYYGIFFQLVSLIMIFRLLLLLLTIWVQCCCFWSVCGFQHHLNVGYSFDAKKTSSRTSCCCAVDGQREQPKQLLLNEVPFSRLTISSRKDFFVTSIGMNTILLGATLTEFATASHATSYSENARNLERINAGDFSGTYVAYSSE
jgi:NADH:ubiquinone oxidoreductase subunit 5 (subunit L)/multisubunit Na+/H+ antiporter MnhA subunit